MKKLLLGLALGGLALGGMVAANNVKAAENFSYKQDFDYTTEAVGQGVYDISSISGSNLSLSSVKDDEGEYLKYQISAMVQSIVLIK